MSQVPRTSEAGTRKPSFTLQKEGRGKGSFSAINCSSGKAVCGGETAAPSHTRPPSPRSSQVCLGMEKHLHVHTQMWSCVALNAGEAAVELTGTATVRHAELRPLLTHRLSGTARLLALFSFSFCPKPNTGLVRSLQSYKLGVALTAAGLGQRDDVTVWFLWQQRRSNEN